MKKIARFIMKAFSLFMHILLVTGCILLEGTGNLDLTILTNYENTEGITYFITLYGESETKTEHTVEEEILFPDLATGFWGILIEAKNMDNYLLADESDHVIITMSQTTEKTIILELPDQGPTEPSVPTNPPVVTDGPTSGPTQTPVISDAPTAAPTITPAPTYTPVVTEVPTAAPTAGPAIGCTCRAGCNSVTVISPAFTQDGTGEYCWEATSLGDYINSWNMTVLEVNGIDYTNRWAQASDIPASIDGMYYVYYSGNYAWSHFEVR